mmetsp:Transcript_112814/g.364207  ORF Transcript_112814/g.364207 Transcript_112814/m.364207 type:complete len:212 (-) Transcript_112814:518-1153(-)
MASMAVSPAFFIMSSSSWAPSPCLSCDEAPAVRESVPKAKGMPLAFAILTACSWLALVARALACKAAGSLSMLLMMRSTTSSVGTRMAPFSFMRSAAASSMKEPCSMVWQPARSAAMMPGWPWQCAATTRSARCASSTIVRISSSLNCWCKGWSSSDSTPPEAQILMSFAPRRKFPRTAFRHSGLPSQQHMVEVRLSGSCMAGCFPSNSAG